MKRQKLDISLASALFSVLSLNNQREGGKKPSKLHTEMTAAIINQYQPVFPLTRLLMILVSLCVVRPKLVREGVYVAKAKPAAKREFGPTKKELDRARKYWLDEWVRRRD